MASATPTFGATRTTTRESDGNVGLQHPAGVAQSSFVLAMSRSKREMASAKKQAISLLSLNVEEVVEVQWYQRKRGPEGRFRRDLGGRRVLLVHILPKVPKAQDCARDARRSAEAPLAETASKRRESST